MGMIGRKFKRPLSVFNVRVRMMLITAVMCFDVFKAIAARIPMQAKTREAMQRRPKIH
jgi:hypothetical protein